MPRTQADGAKSRRVAVVGAGIVGVSAALWLQRSGCEVVLIDRDGPAAGTSFGNGGVLASCAVVPVTGPGLLRRAPRMVLDPEQPLFLRWGYLPRLLPWLRRYMAHANAADTRRIAAALAPIVGDSLADHQALAAGTGASRYIVASDYTYVYRSRADFENDAFSWSLRRDLGFTWRELTAEELRSAEPILGPRAGFGLSLPNHGRITDPGAYVKALAARFEADGGEMKRARVSDVLVENGHLTGLVADGAVITCDAAVLAAGVWSGPLAQKLGVRVPMESERGYHLELWAPSQMPRTPMMMAEGKFVVTPMQGRIRLAGVVEYGGLDAGPSPAPMALLRRNIARSFPGLEWERQTEWMGHRPAPVDSIPVIGESARVRGAFLGFGHHHVGLTGGPRTGQLLARLVTRQNPNIDLTPYSPARFGT